MEMVDRAVTVTATSDGGQVRRSFFSGRSVRSECSVAGLSQQNVVKFDGSRANLVSGWLVSQLATI